jgi:hypothetical protein
MVVRKIMVMQKEDGTVVRCHTIEHQGKIWLIPAWRPGPEKGTRCPARMISLEGLSLEEARPQLQVDHVLLTPLSRDILDGNRASRNPLVIERPDIVLRDSDFSDSSCD